MTAFSTKLFDRVSDNPSAVKLSLFGFLGPLVRPRGGHRLFAGVAFNV